MEGSISVAQEHLATAVFKRVLGWLLGVYQVKGPAPRLVVATPPGEMHEMGALIVAVTAAAEGWYVTYLGPDLPVADLIDAARQSDARAVAISAVHVSDRTALGQSIRMTRGRLPRGIPLLLGGAAARHRARAGAAGARHPDGRQPDRVARAARASGGGHRMIGQPLILLAGASGYVGGRLLERSRPRRPLRCIARRPEYLCPGAAPGPRSSRPTCWTPARCRTRFAASIRRITSCTRWGRRATTRRTTARAPAVRRGRAARPGVRRIVYLGGLGHGEELSRHLASRQEVGRILARVRRSDHRAPGLDRHRIGQPVVRDDPRPGGAAAGDGDAAVGGHAHPADRDRGRPRLPRWRALDLPPARAASSRSAAPTASPTGSSCASTPAGGACAADGAGAGAHAVALQPVARPA